MFTTFDVPFTPGSSPVTTEGNGINIFGQIVGEYADSSANNNHGYLRDADGRFTPIDVSGASETSALSINVTGVIVGSYRNAPGPRGVHCFVFQGGIFTTIDVQLPNALATRCRGINNLGQIVGHYRDSITGTRHGFLFSDVGFTPLDFPGAAKTFANQINNRGQVVESRP